MSDLELLREMRASTPAITPQAEQAGRIRLLSAMDEEAAPGTRRPWRRAYPRSAWRLGLAGVASVAAAAAAIAILATSTVQGTPGPIRLDAVTVLDRAAGAASSQPGARPSPHQWIYIERTHIGEGDPQPVTDVEWLRADGRQIGFLQDGKLVIQDVSTSDAGGYSAVASYDMLAKLPTDPSALLAYVYVLPSDGSGLGSRSLAHQILGAPPLLPLGTGRNSSAFLNLAQLIWNSPAGAPPKVRAALFRAMAEIPGIKVDASARTITGQPVISLGGLLFDPRTYRLIGARSVAPASISECSTAGSPAMKRTTAANPRSCHGIPAGTVLEEVLQAAVTFVSAPGQR